MKEKVIALCSGGFDSICLMHYLKEQDFDVEAIFFDYGQKSLEQERECTRKICEKLDFIFTTIKINLCWGNSSILAGNQSDNIYLEYRNYVFFAYATSLAQSRGCTKIFTAIVKAEEVSYPDCTPNFINSLNLATQDTNISIQTPFKDFIKYDLISYIRKYGIEQEDFCSCFSGSREDNCVNCEYIKEMYDIIEPFKTQDLYYQGKMQEIINIHNNTSIKHAKICINNICNMNCIYCILNEAKSEQIIKLTEEEIIKEIQTLYDLGIEYIDVLGKEPLIDDTLLNAINSEKIRNLPITYSFITNGKTLSNPTILNSLWDISDRLESMTISYDDNIYRENVAVGNKVKNIVDMGIVVNISFDLHSSNFKRIKDIIKGSINLGASQFYIKPILNYNPFINEVVYCTEMELLTTIKDISTLPEEYKNKVFVSVPPQFNLLSDLIFRDLDLNNNLYLGVNCDLDMFCTSGSNRIYVDENLNVYGCGAEPYTTNNIGVNLYDPIVKELGLKYIFRQNSLCRKCYEKEINIDNTHI